MAIGRDGAALRQIRTLFDAGTLVGLTDGQLLERFATRPPEAAEAAFGALVERHGPMVLRVCRGVLSDPHDAQDAFQATFLVLVKKASGLWVQDSLGPWLHRVAYRTACCARSDEARRRRHERRAAERQAVRCDGEETGLVNEWERALHEEIARLPERYRTAVVLCDLEGCPHEQAARHLGCPVGTVKSRLARGRGRLRGRLLRRGLTPAVGTAGALILPAGAASASMALIVCDPMVQALLRLVVGRTAGAVGLPARVVTLTKEVLRAMMMTKLKMTAMIVLSVGVLFTGVAVVAQPGARVKEGAKEKSPRISSVRSDPVTAVDDPKTEVRDEDKLQDTWVLESTRVEGQEEAPPEERPTMTFDGKKVMMKQGTKERTGTYAIDPSKDPKTLDMDFEQDDVHFRAIYKLGDGRLTVCVTTAQGPRPAKFDAEAGSSGVLMRYERKR